MKAKETLKTTEAKYKAGENDDHIDNRSISHRENGTCSKAA